MLIQELIDILQREKKRLGPKGHNSPVCLYTKDGTYHLTEDMVHSTHESYPEDEKGNQPEKPISAIEIEVSA